MTILNNDVATLSAAINALEDRIIRLESQTIFIEAPKARRKNRKEGNDNQQQQRERHQSSNSQT